MNLDKDDSERDEILLRYFGKELSATEREEVEAWRSASPENQRLFDEVEIFSKDLKALTYYKTMASADADKSWEKFREKNNVRSMQPASYSFLKYAASIVVVVGVALGAYYYYNQPDEMLIVSANQVRNIVLPEGSKIDLNEGASLAYDEPFQNGERRVNLNGDAYFDVVRMPFNPFVVEVGEVEVRVLGTKFFVNQSQEGIDVQVEEGQVLVSYKDLHKILVAGEALSLNLRTKEMTEKSDPTGQDSFWKTRRLVFDRTPLPEVLQAVQTAYGVPLTLAGTAEGCELSVVFENEDLTNVLDVIAGTLNMEVQKGANAYTLKGNGCR